MARVQALRLLFIALVALSYAQQPAPTGSVPTEPAQTTNEKPLESAAPVSNDARQPTDPATSAPVPSTTAPSEIIASASTEAPSNAEPAPSAEAPSTTTKASASNVAVESPASPAAVSSSPVEKESTSPETATPGTATAAPATAEAAKAETAPATITAMDSKPAADLAQADPTTLDGKEVRCALELHALAALTHAHLRIAYILCPPHIKKGACWGAEPALRRLVFFFAPVGMRPSSSLYAWALSCTTATLSYTNPTLGAPPQLKVATHRISMRLSSTELS
eukprot:310108-Pleurochrysis_carterae.AAC.2